MTESKPVKQTENDKLSDVPVDFDPANAGPYAGDVEQDGGQPVDDK